MFGDTLQGVRGHRYEDPLSAPGEIDLTAQIDFTTFGNAIKARGLAVVGETLLGHRVSSGEK